MKKLNLKEQRFGRLTVLEETNLRRNGYVVWECKCDCGNVVLITSHKLNTNYTKSCGCLQRERATEANTKHGHYKNRTPSRTWVTWYNMKQRCLNAKNKDYKYYGQRGIEICDGWQTSFINFLEDMGERPVGKTIDRIDPNGNYERSNCRWATMSQQYMNKRR